MEESTMVRTKTASLITILAVAVCAAVPLVASSQNAPETETRSLYERLGGLAPISVVVSDFIDAMVPDSILNRNPAIDKARKLVPAPYLKYHVTAMVCQATGGPCQYTGRGMKESHAHLNISEVDWDRMVEILKGVLAKHSVPEKETSELMAIVESTKADIVKPK
jgi:hemoglobin